MDMPTALNKVIHGEDLSRAEMLDVMRLIMTGEATDAQIGGFLVGLRVKGESLDEIVAAATVMRELVLPVKVDPTNLVDTCGTGGSGSNKFNISTASAFVAAASGVRVAKHGNRGASSNSGAADLLEAAGANIMLTQDLVARCIETLGIGFLFAPSHHSAMKHAIGPRKELVTRTIFNLLGPLTNPAGARRQVLGLYDKKWIKPVAEVLRALGSEHVLVLHSRDGLDEISTGAETDVAELVDGQISSFTLKPETFSIRRVSIKEMAVKNPEESLELVNGALSGKNEAAMDIVCLNAGAAIYVGGQTGSIAEGVEMARDSVGSGLAMEKLKDFVDFTAQIKEMD